VKTDGTSELLVIHIKAGNRGNVPVTIKSDGGGTSHSILG
jgi:hypothetical protein